MAVFVRTTLHSKAEEAQAKENLPNQETTTENWTVEVA